jgi:CheY-like chemotaxis protein
LRRFGKEAPAFSDTQPFPPEPLDVEDGFAQTRQFVPERPRPMPVLVPALEPARQPSADDFQPTQHFSHSVPSVAPSDWEAEVAEWEQTKPDRQGGASPGSPTAPASVVAPPVPEPSPTHAQTGAVPGPLPDVDRVLMVGLPGTASTGLMRILEDAGYPVDFAGSPEAMTERLARHVYQYVLLIEVSLGSQAIRLCRHVQRNPGRSSADLRLLIVASHGGLISRLRAWFAGCHAWLPIPLNQSRLLQYLRDNRAEGARGA